MDGKCKTCKWWLPGDSGPPLKCGHPKLSSGNSITPEDGAQDGEGYSGIYTGPDFGCIHHETEQG
jgi:hypothetical protein